jgi:photosystem II stability/assembly factor-like uncharacterized protein
VVKATVYYLPHVKDPSRASSRFPFCISTFGTNNPIRRLQRDLQAAEVAVDWSVSWWTVELRHRCGCDPKTYYMGTTGGGLWKTETWGISWRNISDGYFKTGSVGAIAVAENDPNVIYVGMGEHAVRGVMTHHGDGVYKSTDAGKTWKKIGLDATQHISRIVVDPKNSNIVFVAAQGALYSQFERARCLQVVDGGATWKLVLSVDDKTGASELSMDMNNPRILYARCGSTVVCRGK